jgi:hypothetical protein
MQAFGVWIMLFRRSFNYFWRSWVKAPYSLRGNLTATFPYSLACRCREFKNNVRQQMRKSFMSCALPRLDNFPNICNHSSEPLLRLRMSIIIVPSLTRNIAPHLVIILRIL